MDMEKLFFLDRVNMTSVYEQKEIRDLPGLAYDHFLHGEGEVLYILNEGKVQGVCSIGDLERFYMEGVEELKLSRNYTSLTEIDYHNAAVFF